MGCWWPPGTRVVVGGPGTELLGGASQGPSTGVELLRG